MTDRLVDSPKDLGTLDNTNFPLGQLRGQKSQFSKTCLTCLKWAKNLGVVTCATLGGSPGSVTVGRLLLLALRGQQLRGRAQPRARTSCFSAGGPGADWGPAAVPEGETWAGP